MKKCPFCAEEIKDEALKCKHCGSMMGDKPVVIERTSKELKKQILASSLVAIAGMVLLIAGGASGSGGVALLGLLMFLGGILAFIITRMRIWWNHG